MKIKAALVMVVCLSLAITGLAFAKDAKLAKNVTPKQAYEMMQKDPSIYVIDVRTPWEFQFVGHIKGAYNIPFNFVSTTYTPKGQTYIFDGKAKVASKGRYQWVKNPDFFYYVGKLVNDDPNAKIVVYCRSSQRSPKAADKLVKKGYKNVYNIVEGFEGGFGKNPYRRMTEGWQNAGLPYQYPDKVKTLDPKYTYQGLMVTK